MRQIVERIREREAERQEYEPQPPSAVVRICKGCGKHYVGLMRWKASREAERICFEALDELRKDSRERWEALQREAVVALKSAEGICRACAVSMQFLTEKDRCR
jgi:hypothetical protein